MATIKGKQVSWSMEALDGVMIQSADASLSADVKTFKGVDGNDESGVEYNEKAEFSINAVCLSSTNVDSVKSALESWCATEASSQFGLDSGGAVIFSEYKISENIEDAKTLDISCTYYPYMKA